MVILSLSLQNSKTIPYETTGGNKKLNDTYADDLTLYLKYFPFDDKANKRNIKHALDCFTSFSEWSGLNINKKKTYVLVFGQIVSNPSFVTELGLNNCDKFTLLGVTYDPTLNGIMSNFDEGLQKFERVANDWRHKYLTIFGKITIIKTFMLSTLSHIATVLPTPPKLYCKKFESIMTDFIRGRKKSAETDEAVKNHASIVSQDVLFAPKSNNGLGLQQVSTF